MPDLQQACNPLVSIITLNYNQTEVTCQFLESTKKLTYNNYEIIVCDMNSEEDPSQKIEALNLPNIFVFVSNLNLGFAAGNNWGMQQAKGEYIFIVNNDTEVTENLISDLLSPFLLDESIGVTCPKIKYFFYPTIIQYAGFNKMNMYTGRTTTIGDKEEDHGQYDKSSFTHGAHGCAMMVKKEVILKTGMFPEIFFLYYEEWDWSTRIQKAGFKIYYQAKAIIFHKESMSVGKNSLLKTYYLNRNRILYIRRNSNKNQLILFYMFYLFAAMPKNIFIFIANGQLKHLRNYLNAIAWNLTHSTFSKT
ncbi:MAG: glycosyltransferase family 2 protein [Gloeobacteraceae cyanobacterium ES-bin-316]|nr:glycosyltransferase family 2 protein [Ferruginibacter sp.]